MVSGRQGSGPGKGAAVLPEWTAERTAVASAAAAPPGRVRVERASKTYLGATAPALDDVTLDIEPGEFFSLLGPSGSGKTTTLRLIAGFEAPDSGCVRLGDADVTRLPPFERDVHTVFQNYALFPHLTVSRNVAYPLRMRKVPKRDAQRRVDEVLELVEMGEFGGRLPHQLSGGQRQRIALARALVSRPQVVLLDEPLGALDLQLRQQMQLVLMGIQREVGCTFVYVTHDQGEALGMSDRLAVMNNGRVEQLGRPTEVYYEPTTPFVASFIGKSNVLEGTVERAGATVARAGGLTLELPRAARSERCTLAIRYEALTLNPGDTGPARRNLHEAVVEDLIFLGDGLEVALAVGETPLMARVPAQRVNRLQRGDRVPVAIDPSDIVVLDG